MYRLHCYFVNEIQRGLAGLGNYQLLPSYHSEAIEPEDMQVDIYFLKYN